MCGDLTEDGSNLWGGDRTTGSAKRRYSTSLAACLGAKWWWHRRGVGPATLRIQEGGRELRWSACCEGREATFTLEDRLD